MKEKLSRVKDWLVFALSLEVNVILTLFLFNVDIWSSIWQVARVNVAVLFFYLWLWFIDLYLNNYSASAIEEKRRLAKEGIYAPGPVVLPKKEKLQPQPKPIYVQPEPVVQSKPVVKQVEPQPVLKNIQHTTGNITLTPNDEAIESVLVYEAPVKVAPITTPEPVVEEVKPQPNNREQLMAWIQEEENKESV